MSSEAKASTPPNAQQKDFQQTSPPGLPSPRRGEIWDVNWSPGRGAEQQGTRPALIIQNDRGNASPSYPLTIVASMSRTERELPLHVRIAPTPENGLTDYTDVKCEQVMTSKNPACCANAAPSPAKNSTASISPSNSA